MLLELCYSEGHLYVHEEKGNSKHILAVYRVHSNRNITLLDRLKLWTCLCFLKAHPRVDCHSWRVFVPSEGHGVKVARLDGDRLERERTLTRVRGPLSVDVRSPETVYIGGWSGVHVVDVRNYRITLTLEQPQPVKCFPHSLAVLGNSVMVSYGGISERVVVYSQGNPVPVTVIRHPAKIDNLSSVSTDSDTSC